MNITQNKFQGAEFSSRADEPFQGTTADVRAGSEPTILKRYVGIALRRRWVIFGAIGACLLLGLIVTLLMTPKYTASSTIEISRESDQVTGIAQVEREANIADQEFYQTQYGLLRSRSLAERVATSLRLVDDPEFFAMFNGGDDELPAFKVTNGRFSGEGRDVRRREAGEILLDHVGIDPARLSRLVDINFTSPDPALSAKIANGWAKNFIETNLERKAQASSYGRKALQRQLAEYKNRLDESQRQLVAYASKQEIINLPAESGGAGVSSAERPILVDNLASINDALNQATADRIQAEARYRRAGSAGSSSAALNNIAINNMRQRRAELSSELENLLVRFEPGYPAAQSLKTQIAELDRSIAREESRVTDTVRNEYQQALAREQALKSRVDSLKSEYLDLRRRSIQYNIYQQEVDTNRALYDGLLQRFKEIGVAAGVGVNNVAIVDTADVPVRPSSPNLLLNILLSIILGGMLGAGLALVLEQLDEAFSAPDEIRRRLGIPVLGTVPKMDSKESPHEALIDRKSELVDSYIAISTNLALSTENGVPRTLSVTSTRPAEGKSTTALALATTLARSHKKVILIDADMRSPSIHNLAGVRNEIGLSSYLSGDNNISSSIYPIEDLGIMAMSAGPIPPNAAELLTGERLRTLLEKLRQTFDYIVVDSPPVLGLADASLIGSQVDGTVYVIESHGLRAGDAEAAVNRLLNANVRILGGILTKFRPDKSSGSHAYAYGYSYGRDEEKELMV